MCFSAVLHIAFHHHQHKIEMEITIKEWKKWKTKRTIPPVYGGGLFPLSNELYILLKAKRQFRWNDIAHSIDDAVIFCCVSSKTGTHINLGIGNLIFGMGWLICTIHEVKAHVQRNVSIILFVCVPCLILLFLLLVLWHRTFHTQYTLNFHRFSSLSEAIYRFYAAFCCCCYCLSRLW